MLRPLIPLFVLVLSLLPAAPLTMGAASPAPAPIEQLNAKADALLARPEFADYRGWLKFLRYEAQVWAERKGPASAEARSKLQRLDEWLRKLEADPKVLSSLRGVQEWAYESAADDSGQPFKMIIPTDYDPKRPTPLFIYMHGYSGNHLEHSTGMKDRPGAFEVAVLGRARAGWYRSLSEADVLDVLAYIQAHWNIDPDRIHLSGGSMGGGATFWLGSRYPHLWASGRPTCGFAPHVPMGNLLHLPLYATHSNDDWVVPIIQSRGPLALLRSLGGNAIADETTGFGHAVWDYAEGNQRGDAWKDKQVRPSSKSIRRIDHTVIDGAAPRGWWAEVAEWGPENRPAHFGLTVGNDNSLQAELGNITRLRLHLAESPLDLGKPVSISINGKVPLVAPLPLPAVADLTLRDNAWSFSGALPAPERRLHTPGGASLLYMGEPLLIVYGTGGSDAERAAMKAAAEIASKNPNPGWSTGGDKGSDDIPHVHMTYAKLNTKADHAVTDQDIARCHLVLIGNAAQNSLVARIVDRLPLSISKGEVLCSDGVRLPCDKAMVGLVYFNPLATSRLIFWISAEDASAYREYALLPTVADNAGRGADLMIIGAGHLSFEVLRSFTSNWAWTPGRERSPLLPPGVTTHRELTTFIASLLRRETGADYAATMIFSAPDSRALRSGVTRICDLQTLYYFIGTAEITLTGEELLLAADRLKADQASPMNPRCLLVPEVDVSKVEAGRLYRIAITNNALAGFGSTAKLAPPIRMTDRFVDDILAGY